MKTYYKENNLHITIDISQTLSIMKRLTEPDIPVTILDAQRPLDDNSLSFIFFVCFLGSDRSLDLSFSLYSSKRLEAGLSGLGAPPERQFVVVHFVCLFFGG